MSHSLIRMQVEDYDRFKEAFDANAEARAARGCRGGTVFRTQGSPNEVHILLEWDTSKGPFEHYLLESDSMAERLREGTMVEGSLHLYLIEAAYTTPS